MAHSPNQPDRRREHIERMLLRAERRSRQATKLVEKWKVRLADLDREGIAAKQAKLWTEELCEAVRQAMLGQADDLGGGVFKKRLGKNLYRSLILAKGRQHWVYAYLFAKKDRANIEQDELTSFRALAGLYASKTEEDFDKEVQLKEVVEICR